MTTATEPLTIGATVWSRKLNWGLVSGSIYLSLYGASGGELGRAAVLTVRKAGAEYLCADCRGVIARGSLHGSNAGVHYCGGCVTTDEPASVFKTKGTER